MCCAWALPLAALKLILFNVYVPVAIKLRMGIAACDIETIIHLKYVTI